LESGPIALVQGLLKEEVMSTSKTACAFDLHSAAGDIESLDQQPSSGIQPTSKEPVKATTKAAVTRLSLYGCLVEVGEVTGSVIGLRLMGC
jgi:hypothetical protein